MIGSLVFSVCIKVSKNLNFAVKTDFWPIKMLFENTQLSLPKGKKSIVMGNSYVNTFGKPFGIRMINS